MAMQECGALGGRKQVRHAGRMVPCPLSFSCFPRKDIFLPNSSAVFLVESAGFEVEAGLLSGEERGISPVSGGCSQPVVLARAVLMISLVAGAVWAAVGLPPGSHGAMFALDDAFITLHNAAVVWSGVDENFAVSPMIGATSLLHLGLVTLLGAMLPLEWASLVLNAGVALLYLAGMSRLLRLFGLPFGAEALLLISAVLSGTALFQLFNGLETGMAMAAVAWGLVWLWQGRSLPLAALAGVLPFLRPELAVLSCGIAGFVALLEWRNPRRLGLAVLLGLLAALPFLLWLWAEGLPPLPNTGGAKSAFFAEGGLPLADKARNAMNALVQMQLFLLGGLLALLAVPRLFPVVLFALALVIGMMLVFSGGLSHNDNRYLYPLLPAGLAGVGLLARRGRAGMALACAFVLVQLAVSVPGVPGRIAEARVFKAEMRAASDWMSANLPRDAVVLIHDAGHVAWATGFRLVDLVGLKTPGAVLHHAAWTEPSLGAMRGRAVHEIALARGVTHAVILNHPFWGQAADDLRAAGWGLAALRGAQDGAYGIYRLTPPGG